MKKLKSLALISLLTISLVACSNSASLEGDFTDDKSTMKTIQGIVDNLQNQEDVKEFEYDSGNVRNGSAKYISGKCEVIIYAEGNELVKFSVKDNGKTSTEYSDDFIACLNGALKLDEFDLEVSNHNKIIDSFNNGLDGEENINGYIITMKNSRFTIRNQTAEALANAIPITIEEIELVDFKCMPPNIIGTIYMQTQFKNNSDQTIESISYTYKRDNETAYLSCYETLLPGEVSTIQDTFGPSSGNLDDLELLEVSISIKGADGETIYIDYDNKTKEYTWV